MSKLTSTLELLDGDARAAAEPLLDRWSSAREGVQQRARDLMAEVGDTLDEAIAADPVDAEAFRDALSAMRARFRVLGDEIPPIVEQQAGAWRAAADAHAPEREPLERLARDLGAEAEGLRRDIEMLGEMTALKTCARWARALRRAAELEWARPAACAGCGGELARDVRHAAVALACAACGATTRVEPGAATALYFDAGVDALAREAAQIDWLAAQHAKRDFHAITAPSEADRDRYRTAARDYWTSYYEAYARLHPGFASSPDDAIATRLSELDEELSDRT